MPLMQQAKSYKSYYELAAFNRTLWPTFREMIMLYYRCVMVL